MTLLHIRRTVPRIAAPGLYRDGRRHQASGHGRRNQPPTLTGPPSATQATVHMDANNRPAEDESSKASATATSRSHGKGPQAAVFTRCRDAATIKNAGRSGAIA